MKPSTKRRILAVYVDFLLFNGIYAPAAWLIEAAGGPRPNVIAHVLVFVVLRAALTRLLNASPGRWALGIVGGREAVLDEAISRREAWWTVLVGTLLVLEGSKNLVRWTQGLPPAPIFGLAIPDELAFVSISTLGALNLVAGLLILRTNMIGAIVGGGVLAVELAGTLVHRTAFQNWAVRAVAARRQLQGLPVRDGEVEFMQMFASVGLPIAMGVGVLCLLAVANRFRTRSTA